MTHFERSPMQVEVHLGQEAFRTAALASEASGQRGNSISARAGHSPEKGSSARAMLQHLPDDMRRAWEGRS